MKNRIRELVRKSMSTQCGGGGDLERLRSSSGIFNLTHTLNTLCLRCLRQRVGLSFLWCSPREAWLIVYTSERAVSLSLYTYTHVNPLFICVRVHRSYTLCRTPYEIKSNMNLFHCHVSLSLSIFTRCGSCISITWLVLNYFSYICMCCMVYLLEKPPCATKPSNFK